MALARWLSVVVPAFAAALIISVLYLFNDISCSSVSKILEDPIAALLSEYPGERLILAPTTVGSVVVSPDYLPNPCSREEWSGFLTVWLFLWGPVCVAFVGAGVVASRHGGSPSLLRSALAASIAASLGLSLLFGSSYSDPQQRIANVLVLTVVAGILGSVGALVAKRHA